MIKQNLKNTRKNYLFTLIICDIYCNFDFALFIATKLFLKFALKYSIKVELISAGIKIYEYTPGFIHSKMFICDDKVSIIGTVNMDYRSFYLHFECGVAFFGASVIKDVKKDMENIIEVSDPIDYNRATSINLIRRIYRIVLRLFAPIL